MDRGRWVMDRRRWRALAGDAEAMVRRRGAGRDRASFKLASSRFLSGLAQPSGSPSGGFAPGVGKANLAA